MKIIKFQNLNPQTQQPLSHKPLLACWGFFDGIHQGHQALINKTLSLAKAHNYESCFITFSEKPQNVINNTSNQLLLSKEDKIKTIANYNFNYYLEIQFTTILAKVMPQQFMAWLIALNVQAVVVSPDIKFGFKGQGTISTLQQSLLQVNVCHDIFNEKNIKIASNYIKQLLVAKDITSVNQCLRPYMYTITGKVVHGIKEGRTIGFPTANLELVVNYALPTLATYITMTVVDNKWYQSMTVIMMRNNKPLVETYLLNFNQDIYDKIIKVKFLTLLRDNLQFSNLDALKLQLKMDLKNTIQYFTKNSNF